MHCSSLLALPFTLLLLSSASFASGAKFLPAPGKKVRFARTYSNDELKNHPLQFVKKTSLTLKNTKGLLTGTWTATIRDIRSDESIDLSATGICKSRHEEKIECTFDASAGSVNLVARGEGVYLSIPEGQGVRFSGEKDGTPRSEMLLGTDEDNREFLLKPKKL